MSETLVEVRGATELIADRQDVELTTSDGLTLVGELALPIGRDPVATLVCLHPLPTHGGYMDSHLLRKAAARLPALADIAVLRFNTRGTLSPRGRSEGSFDGGRAEGFDLAAALDLVAERALPAPWLLGWSFGTEVVLKHGLKRPVAGAILLSPPLHRTSEQELAAWAGAGVPLVVLVPEHDDYLRPAEALVRFGGVPEAVLIAVDGAKHLWVGEPQVRRVLDEVVRAVDSAAAPLPTAVPRSLLAG